MWCCQRTWHLMPLHTSPLLFDAGGFFAPTCFETVTDENAPVKTDNAKLQLLTVCYVLTSSFAYFVVSAPWTSVMFAYILAGKVIAGQAESNVNLPLGLLLTSPMLSFNPLHFYNEYHRPRKHGLWSPLFHTKIWGGDHLFSINRRRGNGVPLCPMALWPLSVSVCWLVCM